MTFIIQLINIIIVLTTSLVTVLLGNDLLSSNEIKFIASRLTVLFDAHIEDVDSLIGVYPAHVGPHIRRVLGSVRTIGTVEPRQLTALELEVIIQTVLACKYVATLVAMISPVLAHIVGVILLRDS